jgi:glycosyltransferase involved in cell wall biosynthesis
VADRLDMSRVHFVGKLPYGQYLDVLQVSSAHVYLTYPFVLSWSMMEAMSAGCLVLGSKTPPVEEMIADGENGLLVDFFDADGIAEKVCRVLEHPDRMQDLRHAARRTVVENYDLKTCCLPEILRIIETLGAGRLPAESAAAAQ